MSYIDIAYYSALYGALPDPDFSRILWDAERLMDKYTTGVDNVRKLSVAFPTEEYAAESVRRCCAALINTMHQIEQAATAATRARGYIETENGLRGKIISSMSAGNESISYSANNSATMTDIDRAVSDPVARENMLHKIIKDNLHGVTDANEVNLLYMGPYPRR